MNRWMVWLLNAPRPVPHSGCHNLQTLRLCYSTADTGSQWHSCVRRTCHGWLRTLALLLNLLMTFRSTLKNHVMKNKGPLFIILFLLFMGGGTLSSFRQEVPASTAKGLRFPYKKAGLTERQAAAHLLGRFTFGARPGQVDEVLQMGLENWFLQQLKADLPDHQANRLLAAYPTLAMTNQQIAHTYPPGGQLLRRAIQDGAIDKAAVKKDGSDRKEYRHQLEAYMTQHQYKPQAALYRELINQKIMRAAYTENQTQEVLTSFWFNHFNVSLSNKGCSPFVTAYERDVIRPNVLGKFEALLLATAKSPAMLTYLDNAKSTAADQEALAPAQKFQQQQLMRRQTDTTTQVIREIKKAKNARGLNENYAREIMELHTLGVDGGYSQKDVMQAARVLTGWTLKPMGRYSPIRTGQQKTHRPGAGNRSQQGFVQEGDFVFMANSHDKGEKMVLGTTFPANGGYEEGVKLIKLLAQQPATARFISTKLAVRFVSDNPSKKLIDKMAKTFREQDGDISAVLITMAVSPEFWSPASLREKTKSPFELAISSVRALGATIHAPYQLYTWIARMGEKMYYYQAPSGFPDNGRYWINTGALLNRMNFGLTLASERIPGISLNLAALNRNREPESAEAALVTYSQYLMPERKLEETIKRLTPALYDLSLGKKVADAATKATFPAGPDAAGPQEDMMQNGKKQVENLKARAENKGGQQANASPQMQPAPGNNTMLAQVVGIIIGSPEFQRR
jgi:uncharacterized protein (DUF1800 family)